MEQVEASIENAINKVPIDMTNVLTLMVTYIPPNWDQAAPTNDETDFMFETFANIYTYYMNGRGG